MKMVNTHGRSKKRLLLPLFALLVGVGVPIYAYAGSEWECNSCHAFCDTYRPYDWVAYAACHQACGLSEACN